MPNRVSKLQVGKLYTIGRASIGYLYYHKENTDNGARRDIFPNDIFMLTKVEQEGHFIQLQVIFEDAVWWMDFDETNHLPELVKEP